VKDDDGTELPSDAGWWARHVELIGVLLIALTAVLTAWTAFESSKWGGVMSIRFSEAGALRTESVRQSNVANRQSLVDVTLFTNYVDAVATDRQDLADFYRDRFPERLEIATAAWLDTDPLTSPDAPGSPFDMPEYELEAAEEATKLERAADDRATSAREANQRGDNYTLTTVFFATVLLLAALSGRVGSPRLQRGLLVTAAIIFIATVSVVSTFPVEI
jgi:hypothetical protein